MNTPHNKVIGATLTHLLQIMIVALFFMGSDAYAKEFYKWTDEKGVLHFTDKPPRDVIFEKVKGRNLATDDEDEAQDKIDNTLKDPDKCKQEKARLNTLKNNTRIQMKKRDGSSHYLSPEEIKAEKEESQKAVNVYC